MQHYTVRTMRCNSRACRTTFGPNFFVENGNKVNTAAPEDVSDVLFVNMKVGFAVNYLKYTMSGWNSGRLCLPVRLRMSMTMFSATRARNSNSASFMEML